MTFGENSTGPLIEICGLNSYKETKKGLLFEIGIFNRDYLIKWLLGFGGRVKVLEPYDIAEEIKHTAEKIFSMYK